MVVTPGQGHQNRHGTTRPFPVADGKGRGQAAATGELVARAVAVMPWPVTFMAPRVTRSADRGTRISRPPVHAVPAATYRAAVVHGCRETRFLGAPHRNGPNEDPVHVTPAHDRRRGPGMSRRTGGRLVCADERGCYRSSRISDHRSRSALFRVITANDLWAVHVVEDEAS
ncbi:hypothetical protein E4K10_40395 [Streptomyces sp. T1317-0309]|nr:hypothetical protein E4K10_40395 [Streptomyces sp. T1317-0309]